MGSLKPRTPTPLSAEGMASELVRGWESHFGRMPARDEASWVLALLYNENRKGQSIIQHNWGNLITSPGGTKDWWEPPWANLEEINAMPDSEKKSRMLKLHERMLQRKAPRAFVAYDDHVSGVKAFLSLLDRKYPSILAARSGKELRDAIYKSGYCPDEECGSDRMIESYTLLQREADSHLAGLKQETPSPSTEPNTSSFPLLLAGVASYVAYRLLRRKQ